MLVIHSLVGGGAERVLATMANRWAADGHRVTVLTLASATAEEYPLSPAVDRVALNLMRESPHWLSAIANSRRRVRVLRRAIRESAAEVVVSFTDKMNVLTLLAGSPLRVPVIVCERTDPRHHGIGPIWSALRRWTYRRCRAAVVQTEEVRGFVQRLVAGKPVYVIPNAVAAPAEARRQAAAHEHLAVAMGRLAPEKGFDLLIAAAAQIADKHPGWKFVIYGEGAQRKTLESLIQRCGLKQVELRGWTASPDEALRDADLFVLPSRYEGFPNALLEAMARGLAVVGFDCDSGPRAIVRQGIDGVLVPAANTAALARALDRLMSDADERQRLGQRAREVVERFSEAKFFERWEAVLREVAERE